MNYPAIDLCYVLFAPPNSTGRLRYMAFIEPVNNRPVSRTKAKALKLDPGTARTIVGNLLARGYRAEYCSAYGGR